MTTEERTIVRLLETYQTPETRRMVLARCSAATLDRLYAHFASYGAQFPDGAINVRLIGEEQAKHTATVDTVQKTTQMIERIGGG